MFEYGGADTRTMLSMQVLAVMVVVMGVMADVGAHLLWRWFPLLPPLFSRHHMQSLLW